MAVVEEVKRETTTTAEWLSDLDALRCALASHPELVTPHISAVVALEAPRDGVLAWVTSVTEALGVTPRAYPRRLGGDYVSLSWAAGAHVVWATVRADAVGHKRRDMWVWDCEVAA